MTILTPVFSASWERRLEVISALVFTLTIFLADIVCSYVFFALAYFGGNAGQIFCVIYLNYFYHDRKAASDGSRGQGNRITRGVMQHFTNYFPIRLVKTVELPPTRNYVLAAFPHGVMSASLYANFASSTTNFNNLFPKIRSKFCTLNFHFFIPFYRDLLLSLGMISVNSDSIMNVLMQPNHKYDKSNKDGYQSNAVVIAVGGSREAQHAHSGAYKFIVSNRKGFVKLALRTGAALVPVISFGENDIFDQVSDSRLRRIQEWFLQATGVFPPLIYGRGLLQYWFGIIPRRNAITTVVGAPIAIWRSESPTELDVNHLHEQFIKSLRELFEQNKRKYCKDPNVELIIV